MSRTLSPKEAESARFPVPVLPIARYRFSFVAEDPVVFPAMAGSAWRGVLGHALKRTVCVTRAPVCAGCLLQYSCSYPYIFETPPPRASRKMRRYRTVPHPYILDTRSCDGQNIAPGQAVAIGLTLVGRGNQHLPYLIHALTRGAEHGIGRGRGRLVLAEVVQESMAGPSAPGARIYAPGEALSAAGPKTPDNLAMPLSGASLIFETPLRVKREGRFVAAEALAFADLFGSLLRRISMLMEFHGEAPLETDFAALMALARGVELGERRLHWKEEGRYSSRQKALMRIGGIVGVAALPDDMPAALWPYVWLGRWVHAGHLTTMGFGGYRIAVTDTLDPQEYHGRRMSESP